MFMTMPQIRDEYAAMATIWEDIARTTMQEAQLTQSHWFGGLAELMMADVMRRRFLIRQMWRRSPKRVAKPTAVPMTPETRRYIIYLYNKYTELDQQAISEMVGLKAARVSEATRGKRQFANDDD